MRLPEAATNSWTNEGMQSSAVWPREEGSVGTSRQPRTVRPSSAAISSMRLRVLATCSSSPGMKAVPTAYACLAGRSKSTTSRKKRSGTCIRMPGAVAGVGLGARSTAVLEVAQRGERLADDVVAGHAGHRGHEGDATRVVLVRPVVEPLRRRECLHVHSPVVGQRTPSTGVIPGRRARECEHAGAGTTLAHAEKSAYNRGRTATAAVSGDEYLLLRHLPGMRMSAE